MVHDANIGLSRHAIQRFKKRIDPTATVEQIISYVRESVPPTHTQVMMKQYNYTLNDLFTMQGTVSLCHKHITFLVARKKGRGKNQIAVITCY